MHLTALRALRSGGFPCTIKIICEGSEEQGTGGLEAFVPQNADLLRADAILVGDTGNFAVGVPTLTTTLRGMTSVDVTVAALGSAMHSGMFGGAGAGPARRPDPDARHPARRATATRRSTASPPTRRGAGSTYPAEQFRSDATVLDGVKLIGDGTVADLLWARPVGDRPGHRRAAGDRLARRPSRRRRRRG